MLVSALAWRSAGVSVCVEMSSLTSFTVIVSCTSTFTVEPLATLITACMLAGLFGACSEGVPGQREFCSPSSRLGRRPSPSVRALAVRVGAAARLNSLHHARPRFASRCVGCDGRCRIRREVHQMRDVQ